MLGGGKTSRLYERLVYKDKLVDDVSIGVQSFALASMVQLQADVKHGVDPAKVEAAIAEEWARFLKDGPTDDELARVKVSARASFIRHLERVNGKASILAEGQVYRGDPGAYKNDLARVEAATPASVLAATNKWIAQGDYTLTVTPSPEGADEDIKDEMEAPGRAAIDGRPAAVMPAKAEYHSGEVGDRARQGRAEGRCVPRSQFPKLERGKLKNGIEVILAQRHAIPVDRRCSCCSTRVTHRTRAAAPARPRSRWRCSTKAPATLDSLEIARREERLGAQISAGSGLDTSSVSLSALSSAARAVARALCRHRAQSGVPRRGHRARARPMARAHRAGKDAAARARAAHAAAAAVRRGPRVCDSVHGLGQRAGDQLR